METVHSAFKFDEEVLSAETIANRTGMGRSTAFDRIREAVRTGLVVRTENGYKLAGNGGDDEI